MNKKADQLENALKDRIKLIKTRRSLKGKIYYIRYALAQSLTENLKSTVLDYQVSIKFRKGVFSEEYAKIVQNSMGWRTSQVPKAELIASQVEVWDLLDALRSKQNKTLLSVKDKSGNTVFNNSEATSILVNLNNPKIVRALERCQFEDRPEIIVTKKATTPTGETKIISREFAKLSLGQQQSILLTILLYSKNTAPLIIDQPEDNLDSEFIYKTLVTNLRRVKEKRQVIIVTHNANITVLGDAELIIPLRSSSEHAAIYCRGSIDTPETNAMTCSILEGSEQAFKKRKQIYGILP